MSPSVLGELCCSVCRFLAIPGKDWSKAAGKEIRLLIYFLFLESNSVEGEALTNKWVNLSKDNAGKNSLSSF